jgi:hypothetical protein
MILTIGHLQAELSHTLLQKSTAEQELINTRLQAEKIERDGKQDATRLQVQFKYLKFKYQCSCLRNYEMCNNTFGTRFVL